MKKNPMKLSKVLATSCLLTALSACAYTPSYRGEFIDTDRRGLGQYWVADSGVIEFAASPAEITATMSGGGRTAGTFWIDSNGRVAKVEITESEPPGVFDYATVRNFTGRTYAPTPENAARRPARVQFELSFSDDN